MKLKPYICIGMALLLGCSTSEDEAAKKTAEAVAEPIPVVEKESEAGSPGKAQAPVNIYAEERPGGAEVRVEFPTDGEDISVVIKGKDGLQVLGEEIALSYDAVEAGYEKAVTLPFLGAGTLAVTVDGKFTGKSMVRVKTFRFLAGERNLPQAPMGHVKQVGKRKGALMPPSGR